MEQDYAGYVCRMLEMITTTEEFVANMSWEQFADDQKTQFAVIYGLEVLAESAMHVPESVQADYPDIPWDRMKNMPQRLTDECSKESIAYAWQLLKEKLPPLKPAIEQMLTVCNRM